MRLVAPVVAAVAVFLVAAGCGDTGSEQTTTVETPTPTFTSTATVEFEPAPATTATTTASTVRPTETVGLYFLAPDGKLVSTLGTVVQTPAIGGAALHELATAPPGMKTNVPAGLGLTIDSGRAEVSGAGLDPAALAQVVYTLTAFATIKSVNGKTRADVESFVPAILVDRPAPGAAVESPVHATGTANTFEATFNYKLKDAAGKVLATDFVTASSGSGTRGSFAFDVLFSVDEAQNGTLSVYELSAENGAVTHERRIPLRLLP